MYRPFARRPIKGAPERFAINRYDSSLRHLTHGRHPPQKTLLELVGFEPGDHPRKGSVRRNPVR